MAVGGLAIATNLLANSAALNLTHNQSLLKDSISRLSSGLRINTAADDPSGLAIAETLHSQVTGYDQATRNIQDATSAATIADGALQTVTDILQRVRTLAVQAASDTTTAADKQALQAEVGQLIVELNRVSLNTSFNGLALLDGTHAGAQAAIAANINVESNAALASAGASGNAGLLANSVIGSGANFSTTVGALQVGSGTGATLDGTILLSVINTGTSIAVQETFINSATGVVTVGATLLGANTTATTFDNVSIGLGNFSTVDVGSNAYIKVNQVQVATTSGVALNFQTGANEGAIAQLGISSVSASSLRVSNINLLASSSSNPSLGAQDAIGQVDNALQNLLVARAQLGSVIVRLQEDANNNNIASTNLTAAESQIRDLNVAQETTNFNRLQILVQVGTSVLAQSNTNAQSVLGLFR